RIQCVVDAFIFFGHETSLLKKLHQGLVLDVYHIKICEKTQNRAHTKYLFYTDKDNSTPHMRNLHNYKRGKREQCQKDLSCLSKGFAKKYFVCWKQRSDILTVKFDGFCFRIKTQQVPKILNVACNMDHFFVAVNHIHRFISDRYVNKDSFLI